MKPIIYFSLISIAFLISSCQKSPEDARHELADLNIQFTEESFAEHAARGDLTAVELFLVAEMKKEKAIIAAAANNQMEIVKLLYEDGEELPQGILEAPSARGHIEMVQFLIDNGVQPTTYNINSPAANGHYEIVKIFTEAGLKPSENAFDGPVRRRDMKMIRLLIDSGGNPPNNTLRQPIKDGNVEMVKLLLEAGARPYNSEVKEVAMVARNANMLRVLLDIGGLNPNYKDRTGWPVLWRAAGKGYAEIVSVLLEGGADPNINSPHGGRPLREAAVNGHEDVVRILMEGGANPNLVSFGSFLNKPEAVRIVEEAQNK